MEFVIPMDNSVKTVHKVNWNLNMQSQHRSFLLIEKMTVNYYAQHTQASPICRDTALKARKHITYSLGFKITQREFQQRGRLDELKRYYSHTSPFLKNILVLCKRNNSIYTYWQFFEIQPNYWFPSLKFHVTTQEKAVVSSFVATIFK